MAPNEFSLSDTLAARALCKSWNNPAHWNSIDAGDWDGFLKMEEAKAEIIRRRKGEDQADG